ncbi:protein TIC 62, chloroplastic-like [Chenopodium quinoa]|uniref:protein TIC 62, chloroplastic-like n=1 Tax=Chenopodium quinoa TaxID=63459 RepID=UPI000B774F1A|nr:protein TIC 62, chloroplastic-like [Chenopodium quinoa]
MELHSLQHSLSPLTNLPTPLLFRSNFVKKCYLYDRFIKFPSPTKYPGARSFQKSYFKAQLSSGAIRFSSSTVEATTENLDSKEEDVVFVAGATGKVGSRTVRELLKLGYRVKAGVRSAQRAESLVQSVKQLKVDTDTTKGREPIEMLEIVECDLEKPEQIVPALGRASVVICCIGASEKEIFDVTGPYRIDFLATKNLVDAATATKVNHFILVTSLGTNKFGFPAAVLNLFWGVLCWKRKAEEALIASGLPYTIVRPGGMERPTDSFKETHNLTLAQEDTLFGGLVSNLQVAELLATMAQNRSLSYCKIVEVVAETTAPLTPMTDLLTKIPSKREELQKTEISESPRTSVASPKTSVIAEAANTLKEELSKEKLEELDAITKTLEAETAKSFISEIPTDVIEKESVQDINVLARPLSPYTMYDDLKPPSSPCPTAPSGQAKQIELDTAETVAPDTSTSVSVTEVDIAETSTVESQKLQPLSPYTAYEDLKPPSSPSPSPPGNSREESLETSTPVDGVPQFIDGNGSLAEDVQEELIFYHSPFPVYEDLKPPTSPTPTAPNSLATSTASDGAELQTASLSNNGPVESIEAQNAGNEQTSAQPKPRPLSPYTTYDDMKPPSSPMPSAGNN